MDARTNRDGKTIEEIGTYDPMIRETDKRVSLNAERVDYWISVGAKPTPNVEKLIEKYKGKVPGVRIDEKKNREMVSAPAKAAPRKKKQEPPAPPPVEEAAAAESPSEAVAADEAKPAEAPDEAVAEETPAE